MLLQLGLAEIEAVDPQPGEDVALKAEAQRLEPRRGAARRGRDRRTAPCSASLRLGGEPTRSPLAGPRPGARWRTQATHDPALADAGGPAGRGRLRCWPTSPPTSASYAAGVDTDPARLAAVEERRAALQRLTRKYGDDVDGVLAWARARAARLDELDERRRPHRRADRASARGCVAELAELAGRAQRRPPDGGAAIRRGGQPRSCARWPCRRRELSRRRSRSGPMPRRPRRSAGRSVAFGPHGVDDVELLLAAHPGAPPRPLQQGRVRRRAVPRDARRRGRVRRRGDPVPTFVFDEVDAGVGGAAAVEVGRRLARLARDRAGARRHPPAAGRGVRRPAPGGRQGQRRHGHPQRRHPARRRRPGRASWPACSPAWTTRRWPCAHAEELLATAAAGRALRTRPPLTPRIVEVQSTGSAGLRGCGVAISPSWQDGGR